MTRRFLIIGLLLCITSFTGWAGDDLLIKKPSESASKGLEDGLKKGKLYIGGDGRTSFAFNQTVKFGGFRIGWEAFDRHRFGISFHELKEPIEISVELDPFTQPGLKRIYFDYEYFCLFYEPIFYTSNRLQLSAPVHWGRGTLSRSYKDALGRLHEYDSGVSKMAEISFAAEYRLLRWLSLGTGVGYRFQRRSTAVERKALNAPMVALHFHFLMKELWNMAFHKEKLEPWK
ncbi:MAG: hypothetical protein HRT72_00775 [Flavobacteriales bacterium]|nr:hypothetical protein [Flavobacteriales bacterium]